MSKRESPNTTKKSADWLIPNYPPLGFADSIGEAAVKGQIFQYPKVVRTMVDPPLVGQRYGCISFMFFKEPRKLSNGMPVYGYIKLRGNWADESQATFESSKIIREIDSKYPIRIAPVGAWVPLTDEQAFVQEQLDVRMDADEVQLRDEAMKEKMAEQRRIKRELNEREDELKREGDIYDDTSSLKYYAMRRVTEKTLMESRDRQINQLESSKKTLKKVQKELKKLEQGHSEYIDQWIDKYNIERRKAGIPDYVPSEEQEEEHISAMKELILSDNEDSNEVVKTEEEV